MQKRASAASSERQFEQRLTSSVPQDWQKRAFVGLSVWQFGQSMGVVVIG